MRPFNREKLTRQLSERRLGWPHQHVISRVGERHKPEAPGPKPSLGTCYAHRAHGHSLIECHHGDRPPTLGRIALGDSLGGPDDLGLECVPALYGPQASGGNHLALKHGLAFAPGACFGARTQVRAQPLGVGPQHPGEREQGGQLSPQLPVSAELSLRPGYPITEGAELSEELPMLLELARPVLVLRPQSRAMECRESRTDLVVYGRAYVVELTGGRAVNPKPRRSGQEGRNA